MKQNDLFSGGMKMTAFDMKSALKLAIHSEIEASEFYRTWAANTDKPHLAEELNKIADWETCHRDSLMTYYTELYGEKFERDPNLVVDPALRVQADEFKNSYSLLRIASAVYISEMRAAELYGKMAEQTEGSARKMFLELKSMEEGHMGTARKNYEEMREHIQGFHAF